MQANTEPAIVQVLEAPPLRSKTQVVVGTIKVADLMERFEIPRRDTRRKSGYQRELSAARVNKLALQLRSGQVDLPTALLLNMRNYDAARNLERRVEGLFLTIDDDLFVVDGQHRIEALRKLMEESPERWGDYRLTFVCLLGANENEEMLQFYIVNSTAKSVRTDLAMDLLKQQADHDPEVMNRLIESGEDWKVKSETLVEVVNNQSNVWKHRVRFPGDPKGETTISNSGLAGTIRPLLATEFFGRATVDNQAKILDAYWQGLKKVLPEAFEDPTMFVLQKQTGAATMHKVLVAVLELVRSRGRSVLEPESYAELLLEPLGESLDGDTREGEIVHGIDFWRAGVEGAAGSYSSSAGQRVLIAKIKALLPSPEIE